MQAILAVHFSATSAFTINFSNDPGCAGEDLGTGYKSINQSINQAPAGIAAGFSVNATDGSDNGNLAVFYSSNDCNPANEIAASNVDICTGADYASLKIVGVADCCLDSAAPAILPPCLNAIDIFRHSSLTRYNGRNIKYIIY